MKRRGFMGALLGGLAIGFPARSAASARDGIAVAADDPFAVYARATLDGVELQACTFADERVGVVREWVCEADGKIATPHRQRVRYGVVRVSWPDLPEIEAKIRRQFAIDGASPFVREEP